MNKVELSWNDVEQYIEKLQIKYEDQNISGVYGVPRGVLVLAVIISHRLQIPLLTAPTKDCLIVDDICDSGESLLHYVKNSSAVNKPLYHISTMIYKENNLVIPEYYWGLKEDKWIVFPWENKNE